MTNEQLAEKAYPYSPNEDWKISKLTLGEVNDRMV